MAIELSLELFIRLASIGHEIVGVELAKQAIEEFFSENKLTFSIQESGDFQVYKV
jgi:hypothetical protein